MAEEDRAQDLDEDECRELLAAHHLGRVAVDDDAGPVVLPVNYLLDRERIVFRTGDGTKLEAARRGAPACFEVDDVDERRRSGWSVVVRGTLATITEDTRLERLRRLPLEPFVGGEKASYVELRATSMAGRLIPVPDEIPRGWFEAPDLGHIWKDMDAGDLGM